MKVVQVMPEFGLAGAEIMCENLAIELKKKGVEVVVVSLFNYHSAITERLEKNNIRIVYLNKKRGLDLNVYKGLFHLIKKEKPDVIHTHRYVMQYVVPVAKLCGVKCVIHTVHNVATKEQGKIKRLVSKFFFHSFNVTPVALSSEVKKTIIEEYKLNEKLVPIIYNGENLNRFKCKNNYQVNGDFNILHVGRFMKAKNHIFLIQSVHELLKMGINVKLTCVGDFHSDIGSQCLEYVKKNDLTNVITFAGLQSNVIPFLEKADCFILPSLYEGMPMVLIEAMATGLPIIASSVGGIPDMIKDRESGLLISLNNNDIISAVKELFYNEKLREKIGKKAFESSVNFSANTMASNYFKIYCNKLNNGC